jgi:hypothetical protein
MDNILDFSTNVFPTLEPKWLVMWEGIGEALQIVCECCTLSSTNSTGARECVALHGMAPDPFSANW